jgi:hypothetical protein
MAKPCGMFPTRIVRVTRSVAVSMTLTSDEPSPLIYTVRPSGVTAMPCGPTATGTVAMTLAAPMSMTLTVLSLKLPTYALGPAAVAPAATAKDSAPRSRQMRRDRMVRNMDVSQDLNGRQ